jgi:hypothetical protein
MYVVASGSETIEPCNKCVHVPTVSLDRASVLFPMCDFPTCPSIIKKYMWSRLPIKARSSRKHNPQAGSHRVVAPPARERQP